MWIEVCWLLWWKMDGDHKDKRELGKRDKWEDSWGKGSSDLKLEALKDFIYWLLIITHPHMQYPLPHAPAVQTCTLKMVADFFQRGFIMWCLLTTTLKRWSERLWQNLIGKERYIQLFYIDYFCCFCKLTVALLNSASVCISTKAPTLLLEGPAASSCCQK